MRRVLRTKHRKSRWEECGLIPAKPNPLWCAALLIDKLLSVSSYLRRVRN